MSVTTHRPLTNYIGLTLNQGGMFGPSLLTVATDRDMQGGWFHVIADSNWGKFRARSELRMSTYRQSWVYWSAMLHRTPLVSGSSPGIIRIIIIIIIIIIMIYN
jgi:hypothetical protein